MGLVAHFVFAPRSVCLVLICVYENGGSQGYVGLGWGGMDYIPSRVFPPINLPREAVVVGGTRVK